MQLFSADAMVFSKKLKKKNFTPKKWKNGPQKLLIIGPDPFISQSSPDQRPTAQNWFSILGNLGTRHLFSYLWSACPPTFGCLLMAHKIKLKKINVRKVEKVHKMTIIFTQNYTCLLFCKYSKTSLADANSTSARFK